MITDPRALSDAAAFWHLVLVTVGTVGLMALAVVGFLHLLAWVEPIAENWWPASRLL